jgi:hypothetical protein
MKSLLVLWFSMWFSNVTVTEYVDQLEPMLQANRDNYLSGPRTSARFATAVQFFNQQWSWLKSPSGCGSKLLKSAGQKCIADRSRSGPWPWETYYLDPIINAAPPAGK